MDVNQVVTIITPYFTPKNTDIKKEMLISIMANYIDKERATSGIISSAVKSYANGFSTRHLAEVDNENSV